MRTTHELLTMTEIISFHKRRPYVLQDQEIKNPRSRVRDTFKLIGSLVLRKYKEL